VGVDFDEMKKVSSKDVTRNATRFWILNIQDVERLEIVSGRFHMPCEQNCGKKFLFGNSLNLANITVDLKSSLIRVRRAHTQDVSGVLSCSKEPCGWSCDHYKCSCCCSELWGGFTADCGCPAASVTMTS
jgi:hypothetical protein